MFHLTQKNSNFPTVLGNRGQKNVKNEKSRKVHRKQNSINEIYGILTNNQLHGTWQQVTVIVIV